MNWEYLPALSESIDNLHCGVSESIDNLHCGMSESIDDLHCGMSESIDNLHCVMPESIDYLHCGMSESIHNLHCGRSESIDNPHCGMSESIDNPHCGMSESIDKLQCGMCDKILTVCSVRIPITCVDMQTGRKHRAMSSHCRGHPRPHIYMALQFGVRQIDRSDSTNIWFRQLSKLETTISMNICDWIPLFVELQLAMEELSSDYHPLENKRRLNCI